MSTPKCKACHRNAVPRAGMVCSVCRTRRSSSAASRPVRGNAGGVLASAADARIVCKGDTRQHVYTTWDVIRRAEDLYGFRAMDLRDERQFETLFRRASDGAQRLNRVLR